MRIEQSTYGTSLFGKNIYRYDIISDNGVQVSIMDYGAAWLQTIAPDKQGIISPIMPEEKTVSPSLQLIHPEFGLLNIDVSTLHFEADIEQNSKAIRVKFTHAIEYRGVNFGKLQHSYLFNIENQLKIDTELFCSSEAYVSASMAAHFNLLGKDDKISMHRLMIHSYRHLQQDTLVSSLGTAYNFSKGADIQQMITTENKGFEALYLINKSPERWAAIGKVLCEESGRVIELVSNQAYLHISAQSPYHSLCISPQAAPLQSHLNNKIYCPSRESYKFSSRYTFTTTGRGHIH